MSGVAAVDLDHGQPPAGSGKRVAFVRVRLLANPQRVELGLKRRPIDDVWRSRFILS